MDINKMKATVIGESEGKPFEEELIFTMLPPDEKESYYGTGYYMHIKAPHDVKLIDVRYERSTDVETLADRWIKDWYGPNAKDIRFSFCFE